MICVGSNYTRGSTRAHHQCVRYSQWSRWCPQRVTRADHGSAPSYNNLRVTGLFAESGRPLSAGYRLHSHGQVPKVQDGSTLVLKVLQ